MMVSIYSCCGTKMAENSSYSLRAAYTDQWTVNCTLTAYLGEIYQQLPIQFFLLQFVLLCFVVVSIVECTPLHLVRGRNSSVWFSRKLMVRLTTFILQMVV